MHLMSAVAMATRAFLGAASSVPGPAARFRGEARRQRPGTALGRGAGEGGREDSRRGPAVGGSSAALGTSVSCGDSGESVSASPSFRSPRPAAGASRHEELGPHNVNCGAELQAPTAYWGSGMAQMACSLLFLRNLSLKLGYGGQEEQSNPSRLVKYLPRTI